jgi:hypothetical protein
VNRGSWALPDSFFLAGATVAGRTGTLAWDASATRLLASVNARTLPTIRRLESGNGAILGGAQLRSGDIVLFHEKPLAVETISRRTGRDRVTLVTGDSVRGIPGLAMRIPGAWLLIAVELEQASQVHTVRVYRVRDSTLRVTEVGSQPGGPGMQGLAVVGTIHGMRGYVGWKEEPGTLFRFDIANDRHVSPLKRFTVPDPQFKSGDQTVSLATVGGGLLLSVADPHLASVSTIALQQRGDSLIRGNTIEGMSVLASEPGIRRFLMLQIGRSSRLIDFGWRPCS